MENPLTVFVSSVISGMAAERGAARAAIEAVPLSRPWLFEFSPASSLPLDESYLSKVRGCDIFVLLLAATVTDPVKAEVGTAQAERQAAAGLPGAPRAAGRGGYAAVAGGEVRDLSGRRRPGPASGRGGGRRADHRLPAA